MAANPVARMAASAIACSVLLGVASGPASVVAVVLGMAGPLIAAVGSWIIVERVHLRAPNQVSGTMIRLFGAKMLLFGAYAGASVLLLPAGRGRTAFVVSFAAHYILLHMMEALYLRRLFSARPFDGQRLSVS